jgi:hypothetical protein
MKGISYIIMIVGLALVYFGYYFIRLRTATPPMLILGIFCLLLGVSIVIVAIKQAKIF